MAIPSASISVAAPPPGTKPSAASRPSSKQASLQASAEIETLRSRVHELEAIVANENSPDVLALRVRNSELEARNKALEARCRALCIATGDETAEQQNVLDEEAMLRVHGLLIGAEAAAAADTGYASDAVACLEKWLGQLGLEQLLRTALVDAVGGSARVAHALMIAVAAEPDTCVLQTLLERVSLLQGVVGRLREGAAHLKPYSGAATAASGPRPSEQQPPPRPPPPPPAAAATASAGATERAVRVPKEPRVAVGLSAPDSQWVHDVIGYSSQADESGRGAHQLVGPPRLYPVHGNASGVWTTGGVAGQAASHGDGHTPRDSPRYDPRELLGTASIGGVGSRSRSQAGSEWVEVCLASPMHVAAIAIFETLGSGSVLSVSARDDAGAWDELWRLPADKPRDDTAGGGADEALLLDSAARVFSPPLAQRRYATRELRLELDPPRGEAAGIDAVRVFGTICTAAAEKPEGASRPAEEASPRKPALASAAAAERERERLRVQAERERREEVERLRAYALELRRQGEELRAQLDERSLALAHAQLVLAERG